MKRRFAFMLEETLDWNIHEIIADAR